MDILDAANFQKLGNRLYYEEKRDEDALWCYTQAYVSRKKRIHDAISHCQADEDTIIMTAAMIPYILPEYGVSRQSILAPQDRNL